MEYPSWDDLPLFLAVARTGTLTAAAEVSSVTPSTVHRRIGRLEEALGVRLFDRQPSGSTLTAAGEALLPLAERVEEDVLALLRAISGHDAAPSGRVHLTAPEALLPVLAEPLSAFRDAYAGIDLQVTFADRFFDLSRREADVAVRPSPRPPDDVVARRIARVEWAVYGPCTEADPLRLPWAVFSDDLARLGATRWWRDAHGSDPVLMAVNSVPAMRTVVATARCRGLLPCFVGDADPALDRLTSLVPEASGTLWVLVHPDLRRATRVRALVDHLEAALLGLAPLFEGARPRAWTR